METGVIDVAGRMIKVGDVLSDRVPSKGIVIEKSGLFFVTSNYEGRDIFSEEEADHLEESLVSENFMRVIGNIQDNPELVK